LLEFDSVFAFLNDMQYLCLAIGAYGVCPLRLWRVKVMASINMIAAFVVTISNLLLYVGALPEGIGALTSVGITFILICGLSYKLMTKWDSLPTDEIHTGNIYEVIGRPKTNLQFLGFILTLGKGGAFSLTDGHYCWYFDKNSNNLECKPLDYAHLTGKKIVRLGVFSKIQKQVLDNKIHSKWSISNNCVTILSGFKNE
jgi:hypothetical protein